MRFHHFAKAVLVFTFVLVAVSPSWADKIPVRGGSTYGDDKGLTGCQDAIANFSSNPDPIVNPPVTRVRDHYVLDRRQHLRRCLFRFPRAKRNGIWNS